MMDKEMLNDVRQTMLKQEAMFREQVRELHNVYWKQKQLTEDVKQRAAAASCQRPSLQPSLELASGYLGPGRGVGLGSRLESKSTPFLAKNANEGSANTTVPRRRTFDLELPAEEYMDVEMEENEKAPAVNSGPSAKTLVDSFAQVSVPGLEGGFVNDRGSQIRNSSSSTGEADVEILQMIKRAKSLDEAVARPTPSSSQSFLGGLWGYGFENNTIGASRAPEKSKANGFHLPMGSSEDKGSVLLKSEAYAKTSENQHFVFLEPGYNAQQRLQQASDAKPLQTGVENFNPMFASAERASEVMAWKDNAKYGAFGGQVTSLGTRMPNHVSYSQGILIPSTNMARRESFAEPALGLWWKSNANYYQPQYQQMALLQAGTSAPSAVQVAWPAPGFAGASSSYPHGAMLAIPAVVPPAGYEENGGTSWIKGNGGSSQAFPYSASTPPKPPFKKPPKLILDGATMELKVAPLDKKPSQELLQPETGDSAVVKELSVEQFRRADDAVESCFRHVSDGLKGDCQIDVSRNDLRGTAQRMMDVEKLNFYNGNDLTASGPIYTDRSPEKQNSSSVTAQTMLEAALTTRSLEQHCSLIPEERKQDGGTESEVIQQSESTPVHADASGSKVLVEDSHHELEETLAEARQENFHTCSCSQPGCFLCSKGTVEDVQMQQRSGKGLDTLASCKSAEPREESRETVEPSSASGKKRRFKLVSSRDLLATRESENGNNGKKPDMPDIDDAEVARVDKEDAVEGEGAKNREADRKRRKSLVQSKALKTPKPDSREKRLDHASSRDSDGLKASSVSRAKDRGDNGCSAPEVVVENVDDGANLAAEILVSLAPTKLVQSGKDGVLRVHHKSKRRLIDTLASSDVASNLPVVPSKSTSEPASVKDSKKKKKKKSGKTIVAKIQTETLVEDQQQKVPLKSVKVVTQCEFGESGGGDKTAAKHKKLVAKKHQMPSRSSSKSASVVKESPAKASTTTLNLVISKSSTRDGVHHHRSHHHHHHQQIDKRNYYNNSSEQESLDRLSQQQNSAGNSSEEIMGKESDELDDSSWSRRSWGASARRKRMRRNKRCGL